jgi:integrase
MTKRRDVGAGSLFLQRGYPRWYIQYYVDGERRREATGMTSKRRAQEILTERLAKVRRGEWEVVARPPRVAELYLLLVDDMKKNGRKSLADLGRRWGREDKGGKWHGHLYDEFAMLPVNRLGTAQLRAYARKRQEQGAANATINREFATLRRMFHLGMREEPPMVMRVPHFPMLKENNARQGFIEDKDFARLVANAGELWLRTLLELAFTYGWRKGELLGLRVRQVNLENRTVRLDVTKNGERREVTMNPKILELLRACVEGKGPNDFVLTRTGGAPVRDFRTAWYDLCTQAGLGRFVCRKCGKTAELKYETAYQCPQCKTARRDDLRYEGLIPHDMRRSGAKALRAAGVPESVIMSIGGWRTASMFRRYAIVSKADNIDAMERLERARAERTRDDLVPAAGQFGGNINPNPN